MHAAQLKAQIEQIIPSAFTFHPRADQGSIPTGIAQIDDVVRGLPLYGLTEICGSNFSSGKTSVLLSLLAQATREHFCALVDAADGFDPASGQAADIDYSRLLWVRCGKNRNSQTCFLPNSVENRAKLPPLEQAFKVADILLQSSGFGLIAVDLSGISERVVRKIPLTTWFRFSRVIERQPAALVFLEQEPHATSCSGLVLRVTTDPAVLQGKLFAHRNLNIEIVRSREKKPVGSERKFFPESKSSFVIKQASEFSTQNEEIEISKTSLSGLSPCLRASVVNASIPQGA